jgi:transcriptional regulator with XRE-family HTH domain
MAAKSWFQKQIEALKDDFNFRLETLILNITETISENMEKKGFNRSKFAEILRVSPPAVTKILNGTSNFTLKTLLTIADALELNLKIDFEEKVKVSAIYPVEDKFIIPLATGDEVEVPYIRSPNKAYSSTTEELDYAA